MYIILLYRFYDIRYPSDHSIYYGKYKNKLFSLQIENKLIAELFTK